MQLHELSGIKVNLGTRAEQFNIITGWLVEPDLPRQIITLNASMLMLALREPELKHVINQADLVLVDGYGIEAALHKRGHYNFQRWAGIDLIRDLLNWCALHGRSGYFWGGQPRVIKALRRKAPLLWPGLKINGIRDGFDLEIPRRQIINEIHQTKPDLLLLGLGLPQQELLLAQALKTTKCTVGIGVGGALEILAGIKSEAPRCLRRNGWEWCFRLMQEPRRLNRIPDLIRFWKLFLN